MIKNLLLTIILSIGSSAFSQTITWYNTPDGTFAPWGDWAYKDILIPAGQQVDSVFGAFSRPGYSADAQDFIFAFNTGATFDGGTAGSPWDYLAETSSLYGHWIDITSFNYNGQGVIRIGLPTPAGAIWDSVGIATSDISGASINEFQSLSMDVYPNPASKSISVRSESFEDVIVMDILGNTVLTKEKTNEIQVVNVSQLPSGTYFIKQGESVVRIIKN
jgi:hypothetical protein